MNKKQLHHLWTKVRPIKVWYLLVPFLFCTIVCVFALRHNNLEMVQLRTQVYQADKSNGNVEAALQKLRSYVYAHMNTSLSTGDNVYPPIQLKYTYQRLQNAADEQAQAQNGQTYTDAQHYCEQQDSTDFSGHNRVPCIEQYVTSHGVKTPTIPDGMYKFDFVAAKWSPDLAGFSLVAAIILFVLLALRLLAGILLRRYAK